MWKEYHRPTHTEILQPRCRAGRFSLIPGPSNLDPRPMPYCHFQVMNGWAGPMGGERERERERERETFSELNKKRKFVAK